MFDLKLLDCTLRDGGYVNTWKWGYQAAKEIISSLMKANVEIIEVGFLRDIEEYDSNITVCNRIEELNRLLPEDYEHTNIMFSAMAMRSNYNIQKLSPYSGSGIEMIRVTAHDYDIEEGLEFAAEVKKKGYKLSINPINIMGYSDSQLLWMLQKVNEIQPYQFSIVDTFGSMKRRDLDRIVSIVDHNLDKKIRLALHLHENMSLSTCLAQSFIDKHLNRPISIDASLMGMGRIPGNLPIEVIADYLNDYSDKNYDIDYMMDAIQDYIEPLKGKNQWGYTPAYFLSARFNLHRNYAEYYLNKGDLTNRDINHILSRIPFEKATAFDEAFANRLYKEYTEHQIDDLKDRERLNEKLSEKSILILAPGATLNSHSDTINTYIKEIHPIIISVNFVPEMYCSDLSFFSNNKRLVKVSKKNSEFIVTSNIESDYADYYLDYNRLSGAFTEGCNSLIMLLMLLKDMKTKSIAIAGADGYKIGRTNYFSNTLRNYTEHDVNFNSEVSKAIERLNMDIQFITPSAYEGTSQ